jgi:cytochrome bd-type quinol oxidase subunit 2
MERGSTIFLRVAMVGMGFMALFLCGLVVPAVHREWVLEFPDMTYLRYPVIFGLCAAVAVFLVAVYHGMQLLSLVDKKKVFSQATVKALKNIKYCALVVSALFAASMPLIYHMAEQEDAPGLIIFGMAFAGAPLVVGVFLALAQGLLQNAIDIKKENDLTV